MSLGGTLGFPNSSDSTPSTTSILKYKSIFVNCSNFFLPINLGRNYAF